MDCLHNNDSFAAFGASGVSSCLFLFGLAVRQRKRKPCSFVGQLEALCGQALRTRRSMPRLEFMDRLGPLSSPAYQYLHPMQSWHTAITLMYSSLIERVTSITVCLIATHGRRGIQMRGGPIGVLLAAINQNDRRQYLAASKPAVAIYNDGVERFHVFFGMTYRTGVSITSQELFRSPDNW